MLGGFCDCQIYAAPKWWMSYCDEIIFWTLTWYFQELPPVEDLSIILPDDVELKLFGTVSSIIEQLGRQDVFALFLIKITSVYLYNNCVLNCSLKVLVLQHSISGGSGLLIENSDYQMTFVLNSLLVGLHLLKIKILQLLCMCFCVTFMF